MSNHSIDIIRLSKSQLNDDYQHSQNQPFFNTPILLIQNFPLTSEVTKQGGIAKISGRHFRSAILPSPIPPESAELGDL